MKNGDTDKFLAVKYPHLLKAKSWLKFLNDKLGLHKGNMEECTRFQGGKAAWMDVKAREIFREMSPSPPK